MWGTVWGKTKTRNAKPATGAGFSVMSGGGGSLEAACIYILQAITGNLRGISKVLDFT